MKRHSTSTPTAVITETESRNERGTRLHRYWLVFARVLWVALFILGVSVTGISLPRYLTLLKTPCIPVYFYSCIPEQLSPESAQALQHLGLVVSDYAVFVFALSIAIAIVWFIVGLVIFWRKSDDWMALLVSSLLIIHTGDFSQSYSSSQPLNVLAQFFALLTIFLVCFLFPSGRFVPSWLRWPAIVGLVWILDPYIFPDSSPLSPYYWPFPFYYLLLFSLFGACVFSQIYRYKRTSSFVQRQQTKWVVYALSGTLLGLMSEGLIFEGLLYNVLPTLLHQLAYILFWIIIPVIIPLAIGIAILRYRLWDIDRVINRTLVYGLLTAILLFMYIFLVFAGQHLLVSLLGQSNGVVLVGSTLIVAALFQPLRQRVQRLVDRRFYRSKYDAAKIIAAYSATLRQEVDLDQLRAQLLAVVQETMQPAHVSLWLRKPEQDGKRNSGKTNALVSHSEETNL